MLRTTFQPAENGFHFSNNDVEWQFLLPFIRGKNVCGGMCYGALDYWYHRESPPSTKTAPPLGTPLNEYLTDRQITAHRFAIPLVVGGELFGNRTELFNNSVAQELPRLQASVRSGRPMPMLLIRDNMLDCHFVLVIACDLVPVRTTWTLQVYDPNQPDAVTAFVVDPSRRTLTLSGDGNVTRGFYADTSYRLVDPPFIPDLSPPPPLPMPISPHVVVEGDTLTGLAGRFYGEENRWEDIYEANRWIVGRGPYGLKAGQVLTIPD